MGKATIPEPVKLIITFIFKDEAVFIKARGYLVRCFGMIDFESPVLEFNSTSYYTDEIGTGLKRKIISFKKNLSPQKLAGIKVLTNKLESRFVSCRKRRINIDPGYLDQAKLVLASTKDYCHRIYLDKGIFAEITLFFQKGSFRGREWTYPDYSSPEYIGYFNHIRSLYRMQINVS